MSDKEVKKEKYHFVPQTRKITVGGEEHILSDKDNHFLAYMPGNARSIRDAEIAAMDVGPHEDAFFEVVQPSNFTATVRVSQPSFDAIKRARPIIDIVKA